MNPSTRLGTVYADIATASHARAGTYTSACIELLARSALVVPAASVLSRDGRSVVAVLTGDSGHSTISMDRVTTGRRRGDEVEIVDGLNERDLVVRGASFLGDGDQVRLVDALPAALMKK